MARIGGALGWSVSAVGASNLHYPAVTTYSLGLYLWMVRAASRALKFNTVPRTTLTYSRMLN